MNVARTVHVFEILFRHEIFADVGGRDIKSHVSMALTTKSAWTASLVDNSPSDMLALLERIPPQVRSWDKLEDLLKKFSCILSNEATVYDYVSMLSSAHILPRLTPKIIKAVQLGLDRDWKDSCSLDHGWTTYVLSRLQHNGFEDFAACPIPITSRFVRPSSVYEVIVAVVQHAVADGDCINIVG